MRYRAFFGEEASFEMTLMAAVVLPHPQGASIIFSFLRLKTMQISYNLPKDWVNKVRLKNAAVYVMGSNLFTLSKFKLWDPELNTDNGASYPNTTSYSVGVNFTF